MATPASSANTSTSNSRWERTPDIGSVFAGGRGGRGRGNPRGAGGGGGRGGRGGSRGAAPNRESKIDADIKPQSSQPKPKPAPPKATAPAESSEKPQSTPRTKPASRRGSRAAPPAITTQVSTQPSEVQTPSSTSRNSRRKRSQGGRGPNPKIIADGPDDSLLKSGQPRVSSIPQTETIKDTPPHISVSRLSNNSPVGMRTNIDALVERVRAVAMDHRPTTPGSHIDWAGDDDDSLPDLDDWGITTTHVSMAATISPIIVDGLKPLPEPFAKVPTPPEPFGNHPTYSTLLGGGRTISTDSNSSSKTVQAAKPPISAGLQATGNSRWPSAPPIRNNPNPPANESGATIPPNIRVSDEARTPKSSITSSQSEKPREEVEASKRSANIPVPEPTPVADSAPRPVTAQDPVFGEVGNKEGLSASIHAPKGISEATSAPANLPSYTNLPKPPLNDTSLHGGRPPRQGGRPVSYHQNQNRTPRGGGFGNNINHSRNHSSPVISGGNRLHQHARPVITGDAISRLARTIVAGTGPKAAVAAVSSNDA